MIKIAYDRNSSFGGIEIELWFLSSSNGLWFHKY